MFNRYLASSVNAENVIWLFLPGSDFTGDFDWVTGACLARLVEVDSCLAGTDFPLFCPLAETFITSSTFLSFDPFTSNS